MTSATTAAPLAPANGALQITVTPPQPMAVGISPQQFRQQFGQIDQLVAPKTFREAFAQFKSLDDLFQGYLTGRENSLKAKIKAVTDLAQGLVPTPNGNEVIDGAKKIEAATPALIEKIVNYCHPHRLTSPRYVKFKETVDKVILKFQAHEKFIAQTFRPLTPEQMASLEAQGFAQVREGQEATQTQWNKLKGRIHEISALPESFFMTRVTEWRDSLENLLKKVAEIKDAPAKAAQWSITGAIGSALQAVNPLGSSYVQLEIRKHLQALKIKEEQAAKMKAEEVPAASVSSASSSGQITAPQANSTSSSASSSGAPQASAKPKTKVIKRGSK